MVSVYLHKLNGLRFFAAAIVILSIVSISFGGISTCLYFVLAGLFLHRLPSLLSSEMFSVFFGYFILWLVIYKWLNVIFERPVLNYPGKTSDGLCIWQPIAITLKESYSRVLTTEPAS